MSAARVGSDHCLAIRTPLTHSRSPIWCSYESPAAASRMKGRFDGFHEHIRPRGREPEPEDEYNSCLRV